MNPITKKQMLAIQIGCILILLFLNFAVWYNGKDFSCDQCEIRFTSNKRAKDSASMEVVQNLSVKITELYDGLLNDYCLVEFDKWQGYILKNETWII